MKLSTKYSELVNSGDLNTHVQFIAFTGTMAPGPESKSKFPAKVFGVIGQEYVSDVYVKELGDLDIENLVAVPFDVDESCRDLHDFKNVIARIPGEDSGRISTAIDCILESGYDFNVLDVTHAMDICAGVWSPKVSRIVLPHNYEKASHDCEDTLFFNMGVCVSAW